MNIFKSRVEKNTVIKVFVFLTLLSFGILVSSTSVGSSGFGANYFLNKMAANRAMHRQCRQAAESVVRWGILGVGRIAHKVCFMDTSSSVI